MFDLRYKKDHDYSYNKILIILPGRGMAPEMLLDYYAFWNEHSSYYLNIEINPTTEWYPAPNGPKDQQDAINGSKNTLISLNEKIIELQKLHNIERSQVYICGFSAGAVMALQLAINSDEDFGGIVAHSGAIFEIDDVPICKNDTRILLMHNKNDDCFTWDERYIPMKEALAKNKYNLTCYESMRGEHRITSSDVLISSAFLQKLSD